MIRKLRAKLIMVSMLSLLIVLVIIIGGINVINYRGIVDDADSVLALLSENGGHFPERPAGVLWQEVGPRFQSPELTFETRFFSAIIDTDGAVLSTDISKIAAVDAQTVISYAGQAFRKGGSHGFVNNYRFVLYEDGANLRVIFLDCGKMLAGFKAVLFVSTGISVLGLAAVFILMLLLSGRIIRPISLSYEKQNRFITDAGHEIKTPVTIIDADAELLEMEFGPNEWLDDIRLQTKRLTTLTNDLIFLSRMEEEKQMQMIEFPISDLVSETASSFQALAITQNKRFMLDVQPMLSFCGNEKSICQLVGLLLDNALKYSSQNGVISLQLSAQNKAVILCVSNSVDSISTETMQCMFDRFYRGDPSRNSTTKGYGIGLSIAKAITAAHKGKITADAPDEHTFCITVKLPA